ncbi:chloride channel [Aspergillus carlsbadensis]|nr:chloride channel [Aspergillus carlsbadensis]
MSSMPAPSSPLRSPSLLSERRLWRTFSGLSASSQQRSNAADGQAPVITEEISEIKRYEDFTTIDWVQDAVHEQARRRVKRQQGSGFWDKEGTFKWRHKVRESYDAGQAWLVITLVGAAIGLISAVLNIITEWLSDIKLGYCTTAFYLNEQFCCWGAEGGCPEWRSWTSYWVINYVVYTLYAVLFAFIAAKLVKTFAPYAAGSGISEIKCIIAGFVMKGFLGGWTLLIKSIALPLAIASGLSVGKEGPSVHFAVCVGNVISRFFTKYKRSASKTREVLTATAAAGVAVAFGSPIGGVLFSLEEMASYFPLKTLWRSYFCALVATGVLSVMNPFRTGQLVMFQVRYDRSWHFFELIFFIILGIFGGLYGALVIKWNLRVQAFRKKYLSQHAVVESVILAVITAVICFPNMFLRINMTEMMEILFQECEGDIDYKGLCEAKYRWSIIFSLATATILRVFLVIISYGCKVPAGIFVPSMAIGASFGRMVGIMVQALHESFPDSKFFAACEPDVPCITPGTYAFLGAGAALSGIMHLTISVTVIMFELTGALTYILPTMIVVGVTKAVGDRFGNGGIADRMIWANGFPFLDNKEDHVFNVPVSHAMTSDPVSLPASDFPVREAEHLLSDNKFQGFPIVEDRSSKILVGYIGRTELRYAIDRARMEGMLSPNAQCVFTKEAAEALVARRASSTFSRGHLVPDTFDNIQSSSGAASVDFSRYVDHTPLTVHPRLPLETVMEIFKKMGPRVVLVEHRGRLTGLVTVKDCLKYQFKVEAEEQALAATHQPELPLGAYQNIKDNDTLEERIWNFMQKIGSKFSKISGRPRDVRPIPTEDRSPSGILHGTEDDEDDGMVELEERQ